MEGTWKSERISLDRTKSSCSSSFRFAVYDTQGTQLKMHRLPAPIPCTVRARGAVPRPVPAATFGNQSPEQLLHGCGSVREQQSCGISSINPCRRPLPGNCPGLPLKHLAAGVAVLMGTGAGCSSSQEDDSSLPPGWAGKHHEQSRTWGQGRKTPVMKFR